ncbi:amino acid-binding protein [Gordonia sp. (in: high G+C Gram-positive bacteria)]|uniref:amino acid-binding protein n=1 Tax=Gordonia sp. (in: high G+C Gram-positive bacteria) TaxID=84139 RepID=UPI003C741F0A
MSPSTYLLRVVLNDRPGSLGMLAVQLGTIGADIRSLEVVEREDGFVVDDLVVDLPSGALPDTLITASEKVAGVHVDSIRPHAGVLDTHLELELIDRVAAGGKDGLQVLADYAPRVLRVSWATVISKPGPDVLRLYGSSGAPESPLEVADWLPLDHPTSFDSEAEWIPASWRDMDTRLAAAPLGTSGKVLLLGRIAGPDFRPAEVARLGYLTGIIGTLLHTKKPKEG